MSDTRKIGISCFLGAIVMFVVAVYFAPTYWPIGLVAGAIAGYLSFEFREVLRAIPRTFLYTINTIIKCLGFVWKFGKYCRGSFHPSDPTTIMPMLLSIILSIFWIPCSVDNAAIYEVLESSAPIYDKIVFPLSLFSLVLSTAYLIWIIFYSLASCGAEKVDKTMWFEQVSEKERRQETLSADRKGLSIVELTYLKYIRWILLGSWHVTKQIAFYSFYVILSWLFKALGIIIAFPFIFGWKLFRLIHSNKRVICAVDGPLGGLTAFIYWWYRGAGSTQELVFLAISGGVIAVFIGIINYELISKKCFGFKFGKPAKAIE